MSQPSGRLQSGLANAIADALAHRDQHNLHHGKDHRFSERTEYGEFLEAETVETIQQILGPLLAQLDHEGPGKEMLDRLVDPEHVVELAALLPVLMAIGYILGSAALSGPTSAITTVSMRNFGDVKPPPMWAAEKAASGHLDIDDAKNWIKDAGMTNVNPDDLINASKSDVPPGVALDLMRRGIIGITEFYSLLNKNGLSDTSQELYAQLINVPPSVSLAFNAAVENQLDRASVEKIMTDNGLDPVNYDWIYETNGQAPGVELLNKLKNYGLIDDTLWEQGLLESPLKNKYIPVLKASRFHRPPMRTTLSMVHNGIIDRAKALEYMEFLGYFPEDAEAMVDDAIKRKAGGTKDLTAANIRGMYTEGTLDRGAASAKLTALGYDDEEVGLFLDYADDVRKRQRVNRAITHIRSQYVGHKIDLPTAQGAIDRLGVPAQTRDEILSDWVIEHEATVRHLNPSEIFKAFTSKLLTESEVHSRLIAMGYNESDAHLLGELHGVGIAPNAKLKDLTQAQLIKLTKEERIAEADAKQRLINRGYQAADMQLLLDSAMGRAPS